MGGSPHCYRSYGDNFFAPPKLTYVQHVVETRAPADAKLLLTVSRFETLEYCDGTVIRTQPLGLAAVTAGVTGGKVVIPVDVPQDIKGDTFILRLSGSINSKPFDIIESLTTTTLALRVSLRRIPNTERAFSMQLMRQWTSYWNRHP